MLSAKKLTEGVTIMCIFLISARVGGAGAAIRGAGRHRRGKGKGQGDGLHLLIYMAESGIVVAITAGLTRV